MAFLELLPGLLYDGDPGYVQAVEFRRRCHDNCAGYSCTRQRGHSGVHAAHFGIKEAMVAIWDGGAWKQADEAQAREVYRRRTAGYAQPIVEDVN